MIKTTEKALEYLSLHDSGKYSNLKKKISEEEIDSIKMSGVLIINENLDKYTFTEKGKEIYISEYFSDKKGSLVLIR